MLFLKHISLLLVLCVPLVACPWRPTLLDKKLTVEGPAVAGKYLAYLDKTRERIILVSPISRKVSHFSVGQRPIKLQPSADGKMLFVLCHGWDQREEQRQPEGPTLHTLDLDQLKHKSYKIESAFNELAISSDNQIAVAYFSADSVADVNEVFRNPNAIAIVDLEKNKVTEKSVRSFGAVPTGVYFSPADMAPADDSGNLGQERVLAAVFADGYVTLVDTHHPERSEVTIHLTLPGSSQEVNPKEIVFAPRAGVAYLLATGSDDLFVLNLTSRTPGDPGENDFVVSINSLAAGDNPSDLALFQAGQKEMVLVANKGSGDLSVIDARTAQFSLIPVWQAVDTILVYPKEQPHTAVVFSETHPSDQVFVLDLHNIENNLGTNLQQLQGDVPVAHMEFIPGQARALAVHSRGTTVMSVVDVEQRTMYPMTSSALLTDYAMTPQGDFLGGIVHEKQMLGLIDLRNLSTQAVELAYMPQRVLTLEQSEDHKRTVVVHHDTPMGAMTVIKDAAEPEKAYVFEGFLLAGVFDDRYQEGDAQ